MPVTPPPLPVAFVSIAVPSTTPSSWQFTSTTPNLVTIDGQINFKAAGFTTGKVLVEFNLVPGSGITAQYNQDDKQENIKVWDQKNLTGCDAPDKTVPDVSQGIRIWNIDPTDMAILYNNHKGSVNGKSLKCNFYQMTIIVGDANHAPAPITLDPIITNGDSSVSECTNHSNHLIPCIDARLRRPRKHAHSAQ
jgi:hypothetical protein